MVKLILIAFIAATFAGCASTVIETVPQRSAFVGFATLSSSGTFEASTTPVWTRLAQLRHNAARALNKKEITVAVAKAIQARADVVRSLLDEATAADKAGEPARARDKLAWAIGGLDDAEITLKGKP